MLGPHTRTRRRVSAATCAPPPTRGTHDDHWVGGKTTSGDGTRRGRVWNPATGEQQAEVALASRDDVDAVVRAASEAFTTWSEASLSQRTKVLFAFRELVNANVGRIAEAGALVWAPADVPHGVVEVLERTTLLVAIAPPPKPKVV